MSAPRCAAALGVLQAQQPLLQWEEGTRRRLEMWRKRKGAECDEGLNVKQWCRMDLDHAYEEELDLVTCGDKEGERCMKPPGFPFGSLGVVVSLLGMRTRRVTGGGGQPS